MSDFWDKLFVTLGLMICLVLVVLISGELLTSSPESVSPPPTVITVFEEKSDEFVRKLGECESGNRDDVVVVDVNNKLSAGRFQYQEATLSGWFMEHTGIALTHEEYIKIASEPVLSTAITRDILSTGWQGGANHWRNCYRIITGTL